MGKALSPSPLARSLVASFESLMVSNHDDKLTRATTSNAAHQYTPSIHLRTNMPVYHPVYHQHPGNHNNNNNGLFYPSSSLLNWNLLEQDHLRYCASISRYQYTGLTTAFTTSSSSPSSSSSLSTATTTTITTATTTTAATASTLRNLKTLSHSPFVCSKCQPKSPSNAQRRQYSVPLSQYHQCTESSGTLEMMVSLSNNAVTSSTKIMANHMRTAINLTSTVTNTVTAMTTANNTANYQHHLTSIYSSKTLNSGVVLEQQQYVPQKLPLLMELNDVERRSTSILESMDYLATTKPPYGPMYPMSLLPSDQLSQLDDRTMSVQQTNDFLSLSLSPPLNRRRDMPALRGSYVSL